MTEVRLTNNAKADLVKLRAFLAGKSERAAVAAADALLAAVDSLEQFPDRGRPGRGIGRRELVVRHGRGGYVIRYRIAAEAVIVTRIFHGRETR